MAIKNIEGLEDCLLAMDKAPENVVNMTRTALREAGKQTARKIRQNTPVRFRRLVGYKVSKGILSGNLSALVGYFNKSKKKDTDKEIPDWFKAYWKNYGTLAHRDPGHHFEYGIKSHAKRRNNIGQEAEHFYESASAGAEEEFLRAFQEAMMKQEEKLYDR